MRRNSIFFLVFLTLGVLLISGCTGSGVPSTPGGPGGANKVGTLAGTVVDSDSGLKLWSDGNQVASHNQRRTFTLQNLPHGTYTLTISKEFYNKHSMQVASMPVLVWMSR